MIGQANHDQALPSVTPCVRTVLGLCDCMPFDVVHGLYAIHGPNMACALPEHRSGDATAFRMGSGLPPVGQQTYQRRSFDDRLMRGALPGVMPPLLRRSSHSADKAQLNGVSL